MVDYEKLNSIRTKDSFSIPTIESTLQQLAGNRDFSKLGLRSDHFQIPIHENDKPKTAFIITTDLWEFNVLSMGLTNAPPSFQRTMDNSIDNNREQYCLHIRELQLSDHPTLKQANEFIGELEFNG
ncbi:unnamed protein product, partial [Rotaria sordida]